MPYIKVVEIQVSPPMYQEYIQTYNNLTVIQLRLKHMHTQRNALQETASHTHIHTHFVCVFVMQFVYY